MLRTFFLFWVALVLCVGASWAQVVTGDMAPDFTLTDVKGEAYPLGSFKGKIVLLEWTNPECPFVRKFYDAKAMQKWQADYTAKGVVWLSVNSSAPGKQGHYSPAGLAVRLASEGFAGTAALMDADGAVGRLYGAQTTPHIFIIDAAGKLVYQGAIDDRPSTSTEDLKLARNYAAAVLDQLLAGNPVTVESGKSYGCSVKY